MIDRTLSAYFRAAYYTRRPQTYLERRWANREGHAIILDLIQDGPEMLRQRALDVAREADYVIPVDMRGWLA